MRENELKLEKLTESLYDEKIDSLKWLLNKNNKGKLDKSEKACLSYEKYSIYNNNKECFTGEVLNAFNQLFKKYINDIKTIEKEVKKIEYEINWEMTEEGYSVGEENIKVHMYKNGINYSQEIQISKLAKMYFHLTTTVGNVMPWIGGFNPVVGKALDIVQVKFPKYKSLCLLFQQVMEVGDVIKNIVDSYYLQDFVYTENKEINAIQLIDITSGNGIYSDNYKEKAKEQKNIIWNLYFYRASKAIMKRSYRILENEKINDGILSVGQNREFEKLFFKFCDKYHVKKEVRRLMLYLRKSGQVKFLKNDYREMYKYLKKRRLNNAYRYIRKSRKGLCFY